MRVHLRSQEHPIVGDPLYGWKSSPGEDLVTRLLLHAHRIALAHPVTGEAIAFEAEPPRAFLDAVLALRSMKKPRKR